MLAYGCLLLSCFGRHWLFPRSHLSPNTTTWQGHNAVKDGREVSSQTQTGRPGQLTDRFLMLSAGQRFCLSSFCLILLPGSDHSIIMVLLCGLSQLCTFWSSIKNGVNRNSMLCCLSLSFLSPVSPPLSIPLKPIYNHDKVNGLTAESSWLR